MSIWSGPKTRRSEDEWADAARRVLLAVIDREHAVTIRELEARASDRVYHPQIDPFPIDPDLLGKARPELLQEGAISFTSAPSRQHPEPITTWHREPTRGMQERINTTSARKRLLTVRHNGWGNRGGAGRGLIGAAGESAAHKAMMTAQGLGSITGVTGSIDEVLGVRAGEIDNSAFVIDRSDGLQLIQILVEVKNQRPWYYPKNPELQTFLQKAALIQDANPNQLILPVLVARRRHQSTWENGEEVGYLPTYCGAQMVRSDSELDEKLFNEVRVGLGYDDMILGDEPTNRHLGIMRDAIPKFDLRRARSWSQSYVDYLPKSPDLF